LAAPWSCECLSDSADAATTRRENSYVQDNLAIGSISLPTWTPHWMPIRLTIWRTGDLKWSSWMQEPTVCLNTFRALQARHLIHIALRHWKRRMPHFLPFNGFYLQLSFQSKSLRSATVELRCRYGPAPWYPTGVWSNFG